MSRKTNRDHGKRKQRPMIEDEAIASKLQALLTPAITSQENYYRKLGMRQRILTRHPDVPWKDKLSVFVADNLYSKRNFIGEQVKKENLVTITRVRSNRVFYRQPSPAVLWTKTNQLAYFFT